MITPAKLLRTALLTVAISTVCVVSASAASVGVGTVNTDALRLRDEATTDSTILATAAKGDTVVVLEDTGDGWYKVDYNSVEGYMSGEYLDVATKADVTIGYGLVQTDGATLNIRSGPGTDYDVVYPLNDGSVVNIVGIDNGWYKITTSGGLSGYVSSDYMVTCKDSAGYTSYVYRHFGYTLNRTASGQLSNGTSVSKSELQPGDLVFFRYNTSKAASHVGIYIGGGQFIHASTNTYTVKIDTLTSGHYANVYVGARRIF